MAAQLENNNGIEKMTKKPRMGTLFKVMLVVVIALRFPSFWEAIVDMNHRAQQASHGDKDVFLAPELKGTADGALASRHSSQTSTGLQQCEILENHTTMDASWLRVVTKCKWMPAGGLKDGIFVPEWHPTLDCPAALKTLVWVDQAAGIVSCPPGAAVWTFYERSAKPALSWDSSQKVTCDDNGRHTIARGWGLLCGNSLRLRPKRDVEAVDGAKRSLEKQQKEQKEKNTSHPPRIIVHMLDTVSRPALHRSLKATRRSIEVVANRSSELGANVFEFARHASVGRSSISNLTPMLTGLLLADMEAKNKKHEAWTFEEMRRSGYVVTNTHNACRQSNLTFGAGFKRNAPDHFFPFQMHDIGHFESLHCQVSKRKPRIKIEQACAKTPDATECFASPENDMDRVSCLGGRPRATMMLEHFLHVRADHKEVPSFGFLHDCDLHTKNLTALDMCDEDKARIMPMLAEAGVFKNTVVIFLSNHGSQRMITATTQGAIECKLPFLCMFVLDAVLNTHSGWREALEFNQQVLTSPRDVHETMIDLAGGRGIGDDKWWEKHGYDPKLGGSSLLNPSECNRSCADAGIPATECICGRAPMDEIEAGSRAWNAVLTNYSPKVVNHMNTELANHNLAASVCRTLEVDSLLHATSRPIHNNVVAFETRFSIASPRTKPVEMLAVFGVGLAGSKEFRAVTITIFSLGEAL
jgi:hypothetical protein